MTQLPSREGSLRFQSDAMVVWSYSKLPDGRIAVLGIVQERPNACKEANAGLQIICGCSTEKVPLAGQEYYQTLESWFELPQPQLSVCYSLQLRQKSCLQRRRQESKTDV